MGTLTFTEEREGRWPQHTLPANCHPWLGCRQATLKCPRKTISSLHPSCLCSVTALAPSCCQLGSSSLSIRILVKAIFQFSCRLKVCCLQSEPGCQWCSFPSVILSTSLCCPILKLSVFSRRDDWSVPGGGDRHRLMALGTCGLFFMAGPWQCSAVPCCRTQRCLRHSSATQDGH